MTSSSFSRTRQAPGLEPVILLLLAGWVFLWALPAFVIGLVAERLLREWTWSTLLWLGLAIVGLGLTALWLLHGLNQDVVLQLRTLAAEAQTHQAKLLQWDAGRLWATTWPIWLKTLGLAPVVAGMRGLLAQAQRGGVASLHGKERSRQRAVAHAQRQAARRLRHRLPDTVAGHMVIGIPLDDEANR